MRVSVDLDDIDNEFGETVGGIIREAIKAEVVSVVRKMAKAYAKSREREWSKRVSEIADMAMSGLDFPVRK